MACKLEIRPLAAMEIPEAYDWYELQSEGLGAEFLDELTVFYNSILHHPTAYSFYEKTLRQGKLTRFPYLVVFEIFDESVVVYSVFMTKQDAGRKRIGL